MVKLSKRSSGVVSSRGAMVRYVYRVRDRYVYRLVFYTECKLFDVRKVREVVAPDTTRLPPSIDRKVTPGIVCKIVWTGDGKAG